MFLLIIYLFHSWHSPNIGLHTEHHWAIWRLPVHIASGCWPSLCSWRHFYSAPPQVRGTFQTLHGSALASAPIKLTWCNQSPSKSFTCYSLSESDSNMYICYYVYTSQTANYIEKSCKSISIYSLKKTHLQWSKIN